MSAPAKLWTVQCYSVTGSSVRPDRRSGCTWTHTGTSALAVLAAADAHNAACEHVAPHLVGGTNG